LVDLVDRLRSRNPNDRPASAEEVIELLEPYLVRPSTDDPRNWVGQRKADLVLNVLLGRFTAADVCWRYGLEIAEFEDWKERFFTGARQALEPSGALADTVPDLAARPNAPSSEPSTVKSMLPHLRSNLLPEALALPAD
jgi:hypothetical protein